MRRRDENPEPGRAALPWTRRALVSLWVIAFALLGGALAVRWDALVDEPGRRATRRKEEGSSDDLSVLRGRAGSVPFQRCPVCDAGCAAARRGRPRRPIPRYVTPQARARVEPLRDIPGLRKKEKTWRDEVQERVKSRRQKRASAGLPLFDEVEPEPPKPAPPRARGAARRRCTAPARARAAGNGAAAGRAHGGCRRRARLPGRATTS